MRFVTGEPLTPLLPAGLPEDWVQPRDVPCPTCQYNLRMLHTPRCPECGSVFRWQQLLRVCCPRCGEPLFETDGPRCPRCDLILSWPALLDSAPPLDRGLYEYSARPVRAALWTWLAALNPWSFWRRIVLEMPPVVGRLRRLQFGAWGTAVVGAGLLTALASSIRGATLGGDALGPLVMALMLPLTTSLALPRFTPTLARFRIRADQLLRCMAYASSGTFWLGVCFLGGFAFGSIANHPLVARSLGIRLPIAFFPDYTLFELVTRRPAFMLFFDPWLKGFNLALMSAWAFFGLAWWGVLLYVALRRYLRLDRRNALALFLSTQAIGVLLLTYVLLQLRVATMALGELQLRLGDWVRHLWDT